LIKGGAPLEALGRLDAIAFDKTGTLTIGEPHLVDIVPYGDTSETELLEISAAVEALSDHPLAQAVVEDVKKRLGDNPREATDFANIIGQGVSARVGGELVHIGKTALFDETDGVPLPDDLRARVEDLSANGRTTMIVRAGERYLGAIGLMDTPRETAKAVIEDLRTIGLKRMMMISGDNQNVANAVAKEVGLDIAFGDLMPEDKVTKIAELKAQGGVAMVGDGVNDAPAMANATVGIAMGAAGSDVALETADIALMADDLETLPFAVGLSRQTSRIIRQNLWASLGIVALLIPATLFGLGIGPAVLIHEGSTLIVVFNALRLLGYKDKRVIAPSN
jgi:Cd2+/Zn2+-exporting ATPase